MKLCYKEVIYNRTVGKQASDGQDRAMLYRNLHYSDCEVCYNEVAVIWNLLKVRNNTLHATNNKDWSEGQVDLHL